jgi:hypothetical protein
VDNQAINHRAGKELSFIPKSNPKSNLLPPIIVIVLVSAAVYSNALFNGFVYDDGPQILSNRWIRDFRYIPEIFLNNAWGFYSRFAVTNY